MIKDEFNNVKNIIKSMESMIGEVIIVVTGNKKVKESGDYKILYYPWHDCYSSPLNAGLRLASADWIFRMDADEEIDSRNVEKISRAVKMEGVDAFEMKQRGYLPLGRNEFGIKKVPAYKSYDFAVDDECIRLFKNNPRIFFEFNTHETIYGSLNRGGFKYVKSDLIIHHWGKLNMKEKAPYYYQLAKDRLRRYPEDYQSYYYLGVSAEFIGKIEEAYQAFKSGYEKYNNDYYRIPMEFLDKKRKRGYLVCPSHY
tara:strand:- start:77 stop:841 length:765 start_codon:yes stop_codon:yes gene_type:complete